MRPVALLLLAAGCSSPAPVSHAGLITLPPDQDAGQEAATGSPDASQDPQDASLGCGEDHYVQVVVDNPGAGGAPACEPVGPCPGGCPVPAQGYPYLDDGGINFIGQGHPYQWMFTCHDGRPAVPVGAPDPTPGGGSCTVLAYDADAGATTSCCPWLCVAGDFVADGCNGAATHRCAPGASPLVGAPANAMCLPSTRADGGYDVACCSQ